MVNDRDFVMSDEILRPELAASSGLNQRLYSTGSTAYPWAVSPNVDDEFRSVLATSRPVVLENRSARLFRDCGCIIPTGQTMDQIRHRILAYTPSTLRLA